MASKFLNVGLLIALATTAAPAWAATGLRPRDNGPVFAMPVLAVGGGPRVLSSGASGAAGGGVVAQNCSDPSFSPGPLPCSGHGVCSGTASESVCVCDAGYTGRSDWINLEGHDCHLNEAGLTAAWAILGALTLPALARLAQVIRKRVAKRAAMKGAPPPLHKDHTFMFCFTAVCAITPILVLAVLKLARGQALLVGRDAAPTLLYAAGRGFFYASIMYAQRQYLALSLGNAMTSASDKRMMRSLERLGTLKLLVLDLPALAFPIAAMLVPDSDTATIELTYVLLNVAGTAGIAGGMLSAFSMKRSVLAGFGADTEMLDDRVAAVREVLLDLVKDGAKAVLINVPMFTVFAAYKPAWRFWTFLLPTQYCVIPLLTLKAAGALLPKKKKKAPAAGATVAPSTAVAPERRKSWARRASTMASGSFVPV